MSRKKIGYTVGTNFLSEAHTEGTPLEFDDSDNSLWVGGVKVADVGTPGGLDTQVQFNDGGAFGGALLFYDEGLAIGQNLFTMGAADDSGLDPVIQGFFGLSSQLSIYNNSTLDASLNIENQNELTGVGIAVVSLTKNAGGNPGLSIAINMDALTAPALGQQSGGATGLFVGVGNEGAGDATALQAIRVVSGYSLGVVSGENVGIYIESQGGVSSGINTALHIADQGTAAGDWALKVDGGNSDLGPDTTTIGQLRVTAPAVPAAANSAGTAGEIAWDSDFLYVCIATNTWKKTALSAW